MRRIAAIGQNIAAGLAAILLLCFAAPAPAPADSRVALVIGNSAYRNVARLANPVSDAKAIADALKQLGFATTVALDQDRAGLENALRSFGRIADSADIAAIYYAGHGMEAGGQNYLIPVDAKLQSDRDIDYELVSLQLVMGALSGAKQLRLVILDACRNNPFAAQMASAGGTRGVGRGFTRVEPAGNTLVAYAAKDGTVADDGNGSHSPFAAALLRHLPGPGVEINLLFRRVRDDVLAATGSRQEPFVYGSLGGGEIYLAPSNADAVATAAASQPVATSAPPGGNEAVFWQSIQDSRNPGMFEAYLKKYPHGDFADLAREKLSELQTPQTAALAPQPQPTPAAPPPSNGSTEADVKACMAGDSSEPDKMIARCSQALQSKRLSDAQRATAFLHRGNAYFDKGEYDQAIQDYDQAIRQKASYAKAYYNRGRSYEEKGDNDRAIQDYDQAIRLKPDDADAYIDRGNVYYEKGDYDRAIKDYDQAIRLKPDYANPYNNRGNAYYAKGDYDRAIQDYDQAIRLQPDLAAAYRNRGNAYDQKGDHDRARRDFEHASKL